MAVEGKTAPAWCYIPPSPVLRSLREEDGCEFEASLSPTDLNHWTYNLSLGVRGGAAARYCLGVGERLCDFELSPLFFLREEASCSLSRF